MKIFLALCLLLGVNSIFTTDDSALLPKQAVEAITPDDLLKHVKVLASAEFGRAPGSKGEELSVKYITEQFKNIGLKPGNPNGSYVPLGGIKTAPAASVKVGESTTDLKFPDDYVASSAQLKENITIENSDSV